MKTVHLAAQSDPDAYEGPRVGGAYDPPERGWSTADKAITFAFGGAVGAEGRPGWIRFVEAVGLSRLLDDPRFDKTGRLTTGLGPKARELKAEYEAEFVKRPAAEVVAKVREFGGFASAYLTHDELLSEPQVRAMDIVRDVAARSRYAADARFSGAVLEQSAGRPRKFAAARRAFTRGSPTSWAIPSREAPGHRPPPRMTTRPRTRPEPIANLTEGGRNEQPSPFASCRRAVVLERSHSPEPRCSARLAATRSPPAWSRKS